MSDGNFTEYTVAFDTITFIILKKNDVHWKMRGFCLRFFALEEAEGDTQACLNPDSVLFAIQTSFNIISYSEILAARHFCQIRYFFGLFDQILFHKDYN